MRLLLLLGFAVIFLMGLFVGDDLEEALRVDNNIACAMLFDDNLGVFDDETTHLLVVVAVLQWDALECL